MIRIERLSKHFPGSAARAVHELTLDVPAGETCVLIGPSGCGKSTTLRMINRLIEPSGGRVLVDGADVSGVDPVALRRRIGYVIQQVGLFPHMTVGENVATVPKLVGWPAARVADRVEAMLDLVGLAPATFRDRYPRQLSGGQRQRVGVARALAADPPVLLMDEPFGALDPITRAALQGEFLRILAALGKTVVFVTHDIDEAIRMGDRIALLKEGRLVQFDTPDALLARPADAFVAEFVGADRALKRLALVTLGEAATAGEAPGGAPGNVPSLPASATLRDALALLLQRGAEAVRVEGADGGTAGFVSLAAIRARAGTAP
jgi:osmoprotectant transport system ATP-binding protein